MSYNIYFDNLTSENFVSNGAKKNLKKYIKKLELKDLDNHKKEILDKYIKKESDFDYDLLFTTVENEDKTFNIKVYLKKTKNEEIAKQEKRKQLLKKLKEKRNRKTPMTLKQHKRMLKKEKKVMRDDERVTPEMIDLYNKLKNSMSSEVKFPNPVEIMNDKKTHMKNFIQYVQMSMAYMKDKPNKAQELFNNVFSNPERSELFNNDYVKYISLINGFSPKTLITSIAKNMV